jgi:hypothetical protein
MDDRDNGTTGIRGRRLVAMMGVAGVLIGTVTLVASVSLLVGEWNRPGGRAAS